MKPLDYLIIAVFAVMSVVAVIVTCRDKIAAKKSPRNRTPEKTLMLIAFFFGSFAMYATMQLIRHKTKHPKFMVGIPVFMALHAGLIALYLLVLRPMLP
ncbi:MAG: DUF1294 domain-containing protein [Clostridiales bacterium]|nr:DUF1294 domain-containing protein [Clostridiales bacterium]